jgi:hypothetical protein
VFPDQVSTDDNNNNPEQFKRWQRRHPARVFGDFAHPD